MIKSKTKSKKTYKIKGMHCNSCATMIELDMEDNSVKATVSYAKEEITIHHEHDFEEIKKIVKESGYAIIS